jgi:hypothetical protein
MASPYAISYETLPKHWQLCRLVREGSFGKNVLDGKFEGAPTWIAAPATVDEVDLAACVIPENPKEGQQCLRLRVDARKPPVVQAAANKKAPPGVAVLEHTALTVHSPEVRLPPGTWVRVSGWANIPTSLSGSVDGVMVTDAAGGEPLALRLVGETKAPKKKPEATPEKGWQPFHFYRQVPSSGTFQVELIMTALGVVYFDDIRVEPLETAAIVPDQSSAPPPRADGR